MAVLNKNMWFVLLGLATLLGLTVFSLRSRIITILSDFIPAVEGFSAKPYWDVNRWSWGYGTAAPGKDAGTITKEQALADSIAYLMRDYEDLRDRVKRNLTANQWAAYLSFSYNLGLGNAYKLLDEINAGDDSALEREWKKFVYAAGEIHPALVERRLKEWELWKS
jgi:GH24 family phage-related lysozyme (muramidase)